MTDKIPELYQIAYNKYLNDFNQANTKLDAARTDNQRLYTRYLDEIDSQDLDRQRQLEFAQLGAQYGDYSHLGDLGIDYDRSAEELEKLLQAAQLGKSYGDDTAYRAALEKLGLPVPEKTSTGTYYGGGSGGTGSGAEDEAESTLYQTLYQSGIRSEAEAYEWLIRNGYNATQAEKLAGYFGGLVDDGAFDAGETGTPGSSGMNESAFGAAMNGLQGTLMSGKADSGTVAALDKLWPQLSDDQKQRLQTVLARYGLGYIG